LKSNGGTLAHGRLTTQASRMAGNFCQTRRYAANNSPNNTLTSMTYNMPVAA
jgi:hypothetical protein